MWVSLKRRHRWLDATTGIEVDRSRQLAGEDVAGAVNVEAAVEDTDVQAETVRPRGDDESDPR
jgi:hypothetical protein